MTTTVQPATGSVVRINPSEWNTMFRFDQAQLRRAPHHLLTVAGQGSLDRDGTVLHPGDTAAQLGGAMDAVIDLLHRGSMGLGDVTRMTVYVTDLDAALAGYGAITERLDAAGATPPATLVQVVRLALPGMTVEIDVTAGR